MNVPFIHNKTLDLQRIDNGVKWTLITTFLGRNARQESGSFLFDEAVAAGINGVDAETTPVGAKAQKDWGTGWKAAGWFIAKKKWQEALVEVQLNPMYYRCFIIQGPAVETVEEFDKWMFEEVEGRLPAGAKINNFELRSRVLRQDDDMLHCLVGLAHKSKLEAELRMLHDAGIFPVKIYGLLDAAPFIRDQITQAGYKVVDEELTFNFLPDEHIRTGIRYSEKKLAMYTILGSGGVCIALLALMFVLQGRLTHNLEAAEEQLMLLDTQRSVLDHQQKTVLNLTHRLEQARRFMGERTAVAETLAALGKCVPANAWLDNLVVSAKNDGQWDIQLQGVTLEAQGVALLLGQLEKLARVNKVELVLSQVVQVHQLYKKDNLRDVQATRFDIVVKLSRDLETTPDAEVS